MTSEERTRFAEEERATLIDEAVWPTVRRAFARHPELRSAVLLIAQYWNDAADDAVHGECIYSELETPDLDAAFRSLDAAEALENDDDAVAAIDGVNLRSLQRDQLALLYESQGDEWLQWNSNWEAIGAFAAFCTEGATQDMSYSEAYTPYAIFRRDGTMEVVGKMLRPHLDGLIPKWEGELPEWEG